MVSVQSSDPSFHNNRVTLMLRLNSFLKEKLNQPKGMAYVTRFKL